MVRFYMVTGKSEMLQEVSRNHFVAIKYSSIHNSIIRLLEDVSIDRHL